MGLSVLSPLNRGSFGVVRTRETGGVMVVLMWSERGTWGGIQQKYNPKRRGGVVPLPPN